MIKRFCNSCEDEIRRYKLYFQIQFHARQDNDGPFRVEEFDSGNFHKDYCFRCVKNGNATEQLIEAAVRVRDLVLGLPKGEEIKLEKENEKD